MKNSEEANYQTLPPLKRIYHKKKYHSAKWDFFS